jgi:ubiquinone/menaquinone biosynthesis C-methylase UbiE/uncharacterized protein YbaR (Trm112 family)
MRNLLGIQCFLLASIAAEAYPVRPTRSAKKEGLARSVPITVMTMVSILKCPISGSDLSFVDEKCLEELRSETEKGGLRHLGGGPVRMHLKNALSSSDGQFIYPVDDGILILLPSLAIVRTNQAYPNDFPQLALETESVMRYYDEVGWHRIKDGVFEGVGRFDDLRPVSSEYIHKCHLRVGEHIPEHGKYLLDAASGPVLYPEHVAYSQGYCNRICVDISIAALRAAKRKLGDKGIYIQGEITNLPLKNASVDGFVSLHTIYHVPEEKQAAAFKELERVLKYGGTGVVVYTWGSHCRTMEFLTTHPIYSAFRRLLRNVLPTFLVDWLRGVPREQAQANADTANKEPELYYHPHDYNWFQREIASRASWDVKAWRSVSVPFLRQYAHAKLLGRPLLSILFWLEDASPHLFGRFGQYPMMICRKTKPNEGL